MKLSQSITTEAKIADHIQKAAKLARQTSGLSYFYEVASSVLETKEEKVYSIDNMTVTAFIGGAVRIEIENSGFFNYLFNRKTTIYLSPENKHLLIDVLTK